MVEEDEIKMRRMSSRGEREALEINERKRKRVLRYYNKLYLQ